MNIAFYEIEEWEKAYLEKKLAAHTLYFNPEHLSDTNAKDVKEIEVLSVFIYSTVTKEVLQQFPNLKLIVTRSMGFDHIDLKYCKEKNIVVCNVPNYGANTVAEHAFSLILAISRQIVPSVERVRRGDFSPHGLTGFDLRGKTLGIIGVGNIGSYMVHIAKGFGMKVVAYTKHPNEQLAHKLGVTFLDLKTLLGVSDIVSIHVPYSKQTHHLINKKNIYQFKKGSVLINTARGGIVNVEAMVLGLEKGILRAVGLDVLEDEGAIKEERQLLTKKHLQKADIKTQLLNHVLLMKENVIITPHNAFNSTEALHNILDITIEDIEQFATHSPINLVS